MLYYPESDLKSKPISFKLGGVNPGRSFGCAQDDKECVISTAPPCHSDRTHVIPTVVEEPPNAVPTQTRGYLMEILRLRSG